MAALTIGQAQAMQQALQSLSDSPALDLSLLLCHVLDRPRSYLSTWPERELDELQQKQFEQLLARRLNGEPIAHILGVREFWSLPLAVTADTLIPRPDTESLVEAALMLFTDSDAGALLDLGTGTGALALALASEWPSWQCRAVDKSPAAVALAQRNKASLGLENVTLEVSDWFAAFTPGPQFDLIVSNPPYIDADDPHLRQGDVRFEPASALVADDDGLGDLRRIAQQAPQYLKPGAYLMMEHGYQQAAAVRDVLKAVGFAGVRSGRDYGDNERYTLGQWAGESV